MKCSALLISAIFTGSVFFSSCKKEGKESFEPFIKEYKTMLIYDKFEHKNVVLAGNVDEEYIVSFFSESVDGKIRNFSPVQDSLPIIMSDDEGNKWDIFGTAVSGPAKGERLKPTQSFMGYFFSWGAFFPDLDIHGQINENTPGDRLDQAASWLVPVNEIVDGGPGRDGIPALNYPSYKKLSSVQFMEDDDLVLGLSINGEIRAYPHKILNYHEIINDTIQGMPVVISYCPLTGTGMWWESTSTGSLLTYGVSGLLYNSNLILYDHETDSKWVQMRLDCINGKYKGTRQLPQRMIQTTWKTWKKMYPRSKVLSANTGFDRPYDVYPYGFYRTNLLLLFPVTPLDLRRPPKEIVHGIVVRDHAKVYRFNSFEGV